MFVQLWKSNVLNVGFRSNSVCLHDDREPAMNQLGLCATPRYPPKEVMFCLR